jgi:hypothetical protein
MSDAAKLPWEFRLLRFAPNPDADGSLTIGKGLAFLLSTALYTAQLYSACGKTPA